MDLFIISIDFIVEKFENLTKYPYILDSFRILSTRTSVFALKSRVIVRQHFAKEFQVIFQRLKMDFWLKI